MTLKASNCTELLHYLRIPGSEKGLCVPEKYCSNLRAGMFEQAPNTRTNLADLPYLKHVITYLHGF